ncbi:MAG: hypothetical protein RLZZ04_4235 [Cyanobacteriota bacterium]|jgi:hypothetical protein
MLLAKSCLAVKTMQKFGNFGNFLVTATPTAIFKTIFYYAALHRQSRLILIPLLTDVVAIGIDNALLL